MEHPLFEKLATVRRRARGALLLFGLSTMVASVLLVAVLCGLLDYLFRFQGHAIRLLLSAVVLGVFAWTAWEFLLKGVFFPLGDLQVAQRIQKRYPRLAEKLASTVEFLRQPENDPEAGSAALRRAVISQTAAELENLDLSKVVDPRRAVRAATIAAVVCLVTAAIAVMNLEATSTAATRLLLPLGNHAWPRTTYLRFVEKVDRVARGQPLEFRVVDERGRLPHEVRFLTKYEDPDLGEVIDEQVMQPTGKRQMFVRKEVVTQSFYYKAVGGDDHSMAWQHVEVVDPPEITALSVKLTPKPYTGLAEAASDPHIRALVGTRVKVQGTAGKELQSVLFRMEGQPDRAAKIESSETGERTVFSTEFVVEQTGRYWFRLEDNEGFIGGDDRRYEIRALPDEAPTVIIEEPSTNLPVTASAVVPLVVVARDDLVIRDVALHFSRSEPQQAPEQSIPLVPVPTGKLAPTAEEVSTAQAAGGDSRRIEYRWDLSKLDPPLVPGTEVIFHVAASDYQPMTGKSPSRRLSIVTPEQLADRIANRQNIILSEMRRLLKLEEESRRQTKDLEIQIKQVGRFSKQDHDRLQSAELAQRQVTRGLTSREEGVQALIDELLADLRNNRIDDPDIESRMTTLRQKLDALGEQELPAITRELTSTLKLAQTEFDEAGENEPAGPSPHRDKIRDSLQTAGVNQDQVIQSLEQMLEDLSQWDDARRFRNELRHLQTDQNDLADETAKLVNETLTKTMDELDPQQKARLRQNSARQKDLARQLSHILRGMEEAANRLQGEQPRLSEFLQDALSEARQQALGGRMRTAANQVEQNQVSQGARAQKEIAQDLRDLLDTLANQPEKNLAQLVRKLREAEKQLQRIQDEQKRLARKLDEAARNPNEQQRKRELKRLREQQEQLRQEAERFARKLKRLQAEQASQSVAQAGEKMQGAGNEAGGGQGGEAAEQAQQAQKDLEEAAQQLARRRAQAEAELAFEELTKTKDQLIALREQQQNALDETKGVNDRRAPDEGLSNAQQATVRNLAAEQQRLHDETQGIARKLAGAEVFSLALKGAAAEMQHAADLLEEQKTNKPTKLAQANALRRVDQLLEALKQDEQEADPQQANTGQGPGAGQRPPGDAVPMIAQLKLLKLLQQEINMRTQMLEEQLGAKDKLSEDENREYNRLSREQGMLADLVQNLTKTMDQRPEENLDDFLPKEKPEPTQPPAEKPAEDQQ